MYQNGRIGIKGLKVLNATGPELLVHNTSPIPQHHVGPGLLLHIAAQVLVRCPKDLFSLGMQVFDHVHRNRRGHHPIGTGFNRRRGVGVHHRNPIRMLGAPGLELGRLTADIQGTSGLQLGHEYRFLGA